MTSNSRLLERLVSHHDANVRQSAVENRVKESVKEYMLRLFNTRKGSVVVDDEFGLSSLRNNEVQSSFPFFDELEEQLLAYEPRVEECRFSLVANDKIQVLMCVRMELMIKSASAYEEELMSLELIGNFMADGTFCFEQ